MLGRKDSFDYQKFETAIKKHSIGALLLFLLSGLLTGVIVLLVFKGQHENLFVFLDLFAFIMFIYPWYIKSRIAEFPENYWRNHYIVFLIFFAFIGFFWLAIMLA